MKGEHPFIMQALAVIVVVGFLLILGLLVSRPDLEPSSTAAGGFTALGTLVAMVIGYYYGSSQGSRNKDERGKPDA